MLQKALAKEITIFVHGEDELKTAIETTKKIFENKTAPAESLTIEDLESMDGIIKSSYEKNKIQAGVDVVSLLAETGIFPSKGEARKTIQGGGISINRKKVEAVQMVIDNSTLLHDKYILVQKGRRNTYLIEAV